MNQSELTIKDLATRILTMQPITISVNGGDYLCASGRNGFYFYKMSITEEYARSIDNFFSIYGYKVNSLKTPKKPSDPKFFKK